MLAFAHRWDDIEQDFPIPLLARRRINGEQVMVARVELIAGCVVAAHQHVSEQMAIIMSGRVRWTVAGESIEMGGGEVLHIPANVEHGLVALEDTIVLDVLSPPGAMGVDSQPTGNS